MIECIDVTKVYNQGDQELRAVNAVSCAVNRGEFVAIMGPSGSGKSTLLQLIGCLDLPTSGEVRVNGQRTRDLTDDHLTLLRRKYIGFIFQFFNLLPSLTAVENVALPLILNGVANKEAQAQARSLLQLVELGQRLEHKPTQMSGGQMQRVALARALAADPPILLGDEPTGNLDSRTSRDIMALLRHLAKEQGRTVLVVSHDPRVAEVSDRILTMIDGCISVNETPDQKEG